MFLFTLWPAAHRRHRQQHQVLVLIATRMSYHTTAVTSIPGIYEQYRRCNSNGPKQNSAPALDQARRRYSKAINVTIVR